MTRVPGFLAAVLGSRPAPPPAPLPVPPPAFTASPRPPYRACAACGVTWRGDGECWAPKHAQLSQQEES